MGEAVLGLIGVIVGALLGVVGGYLTAKQQARHAAALAEKTAANEREQQLRQLAVEITKLELARDPQNPYSAPEHVAVLMDLLRRFDGRLAGDPGGTETVQEFRDLYCERCGTRFTATTRTATASCPSCREPAAADS